MLCVSVCVLCINMFIACECCVGVLFVHCVRMLVLNAYSCTLDYAHTTHTSFTTLNHIQAPCTRAAHTEIYNTLNQYMRVNTHKMLHTT